MKNILRIVFTILICQRGICSYGQALHDKSLKLAHIVDMKAGQKIPILQLKNTFTPMPEVHDSFSYRAQLFYNPTKLTKNVEASDWALLVECNISCELGLLITDTLRISSGFDGSHLYRSLMSIDTIYFQNIFLNITNIWIEGNSTNQLDLEDVLLELNIVNERNRIVKNDLEIVLTGDVENHDFKLQWNSVEGASFYEIEFAFIDNYSDGIISGIDEFPADDPSVFFNVYGIKHRCLENNYNIALNYKGGDIYTRVRAVFAHNEQFGHDFKMSYGPYSNVIYETIQGLTYGQGEHWAMERSLFNYGKKNQSVTYYNNALKPKQVISSMQKDELVMVKDIKYDLEGRNRIDVLPYLKSGLNFEYLSQNISNSSGQSYNHTDIERDVVNQIVGGPSDYYDLNNGFDKFINNNYLPKETAYPLKETEYLRDQTGRISKIGNYGTPYQIGQHDTKIYYTVPGIKELKRLFGDSIGFASHYKKVISIDPNGQGSGQYLDKSNEVVATFLVGEPPVTLDGLPEQETAEYTIVDELDLNSIPNLQGEFFYSYPFYNSVPNQDVNFTYEVDLPLLSIDLPDTRSCIDKCIVPKFSISLYLLNEDGEEIAFKVGGNSYTKFQQDIGGSISDVICSSLNNSDSHFEYEVDINSLEIGYYKFVKELIRIPSDEFNNPQDIFSCLIDEQSITAEVWEDIDTMACYYNCELYCYKLYNDLDSIQMCIDSCNAQFDSDIIEASNDRCNYLAESLKLQLKPTDDSDLEDVIDSWQSCLSTLDLPIIDASGDTFIWRNSTTSLFKVVDGTLLLQSNDLINLFGTDGITVEFDLGQDLLNVLTSFTPSYWQAQWEDILLPCHIDYCALGICEAMLPSDSFDIVLTSFESLDEAIAVFGVQTSNILSTQLNFLNTVIRANDPFEDLTLNCNLSMQIDDFYDDFLCQFFEDGTYANDICRAVSGNSFATCSDCEIGELVQYILNQNSEVDAWSIYVSIYIGAKQRLLEACSMSFCPLSDATQEILGDKSFVLISTEQDIISLTDSIWDSNTVQDSVDCADRVAYWMETYDTLLLTMTMNERNEIISLLERYCQRNCDEFDFGMDRYNQCQIFPNFKPSVLESRAITSPDSPDCVVLVPPTTNVVLDGVCLNDIELQGFIEIDNNDLDKRFVFALDYVNQVFPLNVSAALYYGDLIPTDSTLELVECYGSYGRFGDLVIDLDLSAPTTGYYYLVLFTAEDLGASLGIEYFIRDKISIDGISDHAYHDLEALNTIIGNIDYTLVDTLIDLIWPCDEDCIELDSCLLEILFGSYGTNSFCYDSIIFQQYYWYNNKQILLPHSVIYVGGKSFRFLLIEEDGFYRSTLSGIDKIHYIKRRAFPSEEYKIYLPNAEVLDIEMGISTRGSYYRRAWPVLFDVSDSLDVAFNHRSCIADFCDEICELELCKEELIEDANYRINRIIQDSLNYYASVFADSLENMLPIENLSVERGILEYFYTLFYRDLVGNIVKTIPPEGVVISTNESYWGREHKEDHFTIKEYNSYNLQLSTHNTSSGLTKYFYDDALRLRQLQDAERRSYSHTLYYKYDMSNRMVESGLTRLNSNIHAIENPSYPTSAVFNRVWTNYDFADVRAEIAQFNTRLNVSSIEYESSSKLFYSYNLHQMPVSFEQSYDGRLPKIMKYQYDIITGQVEALAYQKDSIDSYYIRYLYDDDNRLEYVMSSRDNRLWDENARYFYYAHGPLARLEYGDRKVQGMDYYYTLQSWLKGINMSNARNNRVHDPGKDAAKGDEYINKLVGDDAFALYLGYNKDDYSATNFTAWNNALNWGKLYGSATNDPGLYDGQIAALVVDNPKLENGAFGRLHGHRYRYDQMYRLKKDLSRKFNNGLNWNNAQSYFTSSYTYDGNGNITSLQRSEHIGTISSTFDDLTYNYSTMNRPNLLNHVNDLVADGVHNHDVDNQQVNSYDYNEIGQLISQLDGNNTYTRSWNIYGLLEEETSQRTIKFKYNGLHKKISKEESLAGSQSPTNYTLLDYYYYYDIAGNLFSIYKKKSDYSDNNNPSERPTQVVETDFSQEAVYLRGDRLIAMDMRDVNFQSDTVPTKHFAHIEGNYRYYLNDHLGSTRVQLSDLKFYSLAGRYEGEVKDYTDYYAFGFENRQRTSTYLGPDNGISYTGQMRDTRFGDREYLDYGARIYDPGIARFISVDPLADDYASWSPYNYTLNNPLRYTDPTGMGPEGGPGDPPETTPTVAGILFDGFQNARSGLFNLTSRFIFGSDKRMRVNYNSDGTIPTNNPVVVESTVKQGFLSESADVALDVLSLLPMVPGSTIGKTMTAPFLMARTPSIIPGLKYLKQEISFSQETINFIQGSKEKAKIVNAKLPEGFRPVASNHKAKIYTNGKAYISPDLDGHKGGVWKAADSVKNLFSRDTRWGTYDSNLKRVAD